MLARALLNQNPERVAAIARWCDVDAAHAEAVGLLVWREDELLPQADGDRVATIRLIYTEPEAQPEKPKKPRRVRRTKAQIAADKAAQADADQAEAIQAEAAAPTPEAPSEDDVRAAVKAAVVDGQLEAVNKAFTLVGVECVSDVAEKDRATVIAAITGKL